ncbi:MAG TPA: oligopeptide/dipeptide ABC transporter ATP-binding protein [Reyranella sp.]|nr:oligopeptide/dipeptide ABC transporter ATP-binding protein [Reyranella sp.]
MNAILDVYGLKKHFAARGGGLGLAQTKVRAVDDVTLSIWPGETLAVVGESGCGKSTLGRLILCLERPTAGEVWLDGWRIDAMPSPQLRPLRAQIQAVFQDPMSSLNPRMRVRDIIAEPLVNFRLASGRREIDTRVGDLLEQVGLPREAMTRFPREFSGGQRQRIGIARALAPSPRLLVCDEAVSALDVSVKAQIVNLLCDLQQQLGLALLFISHDIAIVEHISDRVAVMYLGVVVEVAERAALFARPAHPYTRSLLSSVPASTPSERGRAIALGGEPPNPADMPSGCRFHTRCPHAFERCLTEAPVLRERGAGHRAACHLDL